MPLIKMETPFISSYSLPSNSGHAPISPFGFLQAVNGEIITNAGDRQAIANLLRLIAKSPSVQSQIAAISRTESRQ